MAQIVEGKGPQHMESAGEKGGQQECGAGHAQKAESQLCVGARSCGE